MHLERSNKSQFTETIEALRVYAATAYKPDIEALTVLFTKLEKPSVKEPDDPAEETRTVKGVSITEVSKFKEMVYAESVKQ